MLRVHHVWVENEKFQATEINLPKTNLLVIESDTGYVMCGALDIQLLRTKLRDRGVIAARAVGVKSMDDLLDGTVESCTQEAEKIGICAGTSIRDALMRMRTHEKAIAPGSR